MRISYTLGLGVFFGLYLLPQAQLDLARLSSQTVKTGQPWAAIQTSIEDLDVHIEVNRGVVTTQATITYLPGMGEVPVYDCRVIKDDCAQGDSAGCLRQVCDYQTGPALTLDSLETSAYFNLGDNAIVTDLYLWVGETKVKAALQERALASAQYESIVQRRRDPALLESWGGGSYYLRVFPNESGKARQLQIEFVQGMENTGGSFKNVFPIQYSLFQLPQPDSSTYKTIKRFKVSVAAIDGNSYELNWPGVGKGAIGSSPKVFEGRDVAEIGIGSLSSPAATCPGCLTPWMAQKKEMGYFGVHADLVAKNITFGEQPRERNVILDVHADGSDTAGAERARKLALLSLKAYAAAPFTANLGFSNGMGEVKYVFSKPVSIGPQELQIAYNALRNWTPSRASDAKSAIQNFASTHKGGSDPCVLFLINNDTSSYYSWPGGVWDEAAQKAYQKFEADQALKDSALAEALKQAGVMLFGYWNNYRLSNVATATGGYQGGSLYGAYYRYYPIEIAPASAPADPFANLQMQPLFGPGRPDAYQIVDLQVKHSGVPVNDWVVLQSYAYDNYDYVADDRVALQKASSAIYGYRPPNRDTIGLRLSGGFQGQGRLTLEVSGLWGGLPFVEEYTVDLNQNPAASQLGAGLWAHLQGEAWERDYRGDHVKDLQALGEEFHIVNRQMSLLALEPGMDLWTDMPSKTSSSGEAASQDAKQSIPDAYAGNPLDQITLEAILSDFVAIGPRNGVAKKPIGDFVARRIGEQIEFAWELPGDLPIATFRIVTPNGREVASLQGLRIGANRKAIWDSPRQSGVYLVIAKAGKFTRMQKLRIGL